MAQISFQFYNGMDVYNDGDVEQKLLKHYRDGRDVDYDSDDIFYLTTHIRSNILNWYSFGKEDDVLEIGSGCGTLTGTICQKCKSVCSVEGSKRRAEITYERNKQYDNLMVYAAEFGKFKLEKQFDYVVLIGVFEYAKRFFDEKEPFKFFLAEIKKVLKPNGKVLIAIENRYGLKYWAGANEDHLAMPYVGFSRYDEYDVQTFGQKELVDLIHEMGFEHYKFYYPFPDYKLPELIYTDARLPHKDELVTLPNYLYGDKANFDLRDVYGGLIQNEQFGFFSNSLVLEFGYEENMSNVIYVKELSYREKEYRIITLQKKNLNFLKMTAAPEARGHLRNILSIYNVLCEKNIPIADVKQIDEDTLEIEFCQGKSVADSMLSRISKTGMACLGEELNKLWNFFCSISDEAELTNPIDERLNVLYPEKTPVLKAAIMDGNAANIIINDKGEYIFIDQEWMEEGQLPAEYLMYYSLRHIGNICKMSQEEVEKWTIHFHITKEKEQLFIQIEKSFYGTKNIVDVRIKQKQDELCSYSKGEEIDTLPVCYYDLGTGFREEQKIYGNYVKNNGLFTFTFTVPEETKEVRIDPALEGARYISFDTVLLNGEAVNYKECNMINWNGKKILAGHNPYICFKNCCKENVFEINLRKMSLTEVEQYLKESNCCEKVDATSIDTVPVCYFNRGNGFNEAEKTYGYYERNKGYYEARFSLPEGVSEVRIDPALCGERCIGFTTILVNGRSIDYRVYNMVICETKKLLTEKNPYLIFNVKESEFVFSIDLQKLTTEEMEFYLHNR